MRSLINLIRADLREFKAYSSARDEAACAAICLNANESPYVNLSEQEQLLNRYPEKQPKKLIQILAELYQVEINQLLISRGSDEVIDLLTRLFCRAGEDAVIVCPPTFGMYAVCAQLQAAKVIEVPLLKQNSYQLDKQTILAKIDNSVKIIFLCSPNNPTGNVLNQNEILALVDAVKDQCIVVVDEAYIEFSEAESLSKQILQYNNLLILRTLSKAHGLAAARCGVLIAQEELIEWILKIMPPYPTPSTTAVIVLQSLAKSKNLLQQQIKQIKAERENLFEQLSKLDCIKKVWSSEANFLLVETTDASTVMQHCADNGIILRNMHGKWNLDQCIRISIGLPQENKQLIEVLSKLR